MYYVCTFILTIKKNVILLKYLLSHLFRNEPLIIGRSSRIHSVVSNWSYFKFCTNFIIVSLNPSFNKLGAHPKHPSECGGDELLVNFLVNIRVFDKSWEADNEPNHHTP